MKKRTIAAACLLSVLAASGTLAQVHHEVGERDGLPWARVKLDAPSMQVECAVRDACGFLPYAPEEATAYWNPVTGEWLFFVGHAGVRACMNLTCLDSTRPDKYGDTHNWTHLDYDAQGLIKVEQAVFWTAVSPEEAQQETPFHIHYHYPEHALLVGTGLPADDVSLAAATFVLFDESPTMRTLCYWIDLGPGPLLPMRSLIPLTKWVGFTGGGKGLWESQMCTP